MKIKIIEKKIEYILFIPPCDIQEVAEKCGFEVFDAATNKTPEEESMIALLKLERREFLETKCFTKMEQECVTCSACGKPCGIIHDLNLSNCCFSKIK